MTFRIDTISLDGAGPGRWVCAFKGFRGRLRRQVRRALAVPDRERRGGRQLRVA